jgi:hypothetical protein
MEIIRTALADPMVRGLYLLFCFTLLIVPMIGLTYWYHARIRRTTGGRELMKEQARIGVRPHSVGAGIRMARDVASNRFGSDARILQNRTYTIVCLWVILNVTVFAVLMWADEVNR